MTRLSDLTPKFSGQGALCASGRTAVGATGARVAVGVAVGVAAAVTEGSGPEEAAEEGSRSKRAF